MILIVPIPTVLLSACESPVTHFVSTFTVLSTGIKKSSIDRLKTFKKYMLLSSLMGPVDGSPEGDAIIVGVNVLSCGRLGVSCTASLPFLHMAAQLSVTGIWGLHSCL